MSDISDGAGHWWTLSMVYLEGREGIPVIFRYMSPTKRPTDPMPDVMLLVFPSSKGAGDPFKLSGTTSRRECLGQGE